MPFIPTQDAHDPLCPSATQPSHFPKLGAGQQTVFLSFLLQFNIFISPLNEEYIHMVQNPTGAEEPITTRAHQPASPSPSHPVRS